MTKSAAFTGFCALLLCTTAAYADVVTGSFDGTISSGTDSTGVFGPTGSLASDSITGTFTYNTTLFNASVMGSTNTATANSSGALTVTIVIGGVSHTFTDQTSSGIFLGTSSSEITLTSANSQIGGDSSTNETFYLNAFDPITPFILSTSLAQTFSASPAFSTGVFTILDTGPNAVANGVFSLTSITATDEVPEPASIVMFLTGLAGIAVFGTGTRLRAQRLYQRLIARVAVPLADGLRT